ncbi:transcriptional regulator, LysR family [Rhodoferax ferrireducens T118]|uniref:Transcriptional regulator, LysR family n=1 Tax=Albidiferax ferrireducens (strain ATCC BAA-621 / DSM 15236 / T118) TaxID=338969 RepID=Q21Z48_ALBFT|nr:LysR family transcriptional regulator [Rhodoferax ferrireducens]ABD68955.1 transcriptional regulator, LysR family [Rhodoferax ferrireducens T118]
MDRSAEMTAFVRAVETGGFTAAAREIGLTPSALSKLVTRLEDRLGARLLQRTTRRLQLTSEGEAFYARARPILLAMDEAEAEVSQAGLSPRGLLRLQCGTAFGMHQLARTIPHFQALYPDVQLDITISDRPPADMKEGIDLTIRTGPLDDSSMVARRICTLERVICAAPSYLALHGTPRTPDDLQRHNCLWISNLPALRRWPFDTEDGIRVVHIGGNVVANNAETVLQLAVAGVGITRLTNVIVSAAIARRELVPILTDWHHVEPVPLFASYPSGRNLAPKVRAMVDFLVDFFKDSDQQFQRVTPVGSP